MGLKLRARAVMTASRSESESMGAPLKLEGSSGSESRRAGALADMAASVYGG